MSVADQIDEVRTLLRASIETMLRRVYGFEQRRAAHDSPGGESADAWAAYAALGLLSLGLPEAHGGITAGLADIAMAAELMGGAMTLEPYRPTMIVARLLAVAGTARQQADWLPGVAAGTVHAALAHGEGRAGSGDPIGTIATREGAGWRITGRKAVVLGGDTADLFIVSALTRRGTALFLVPRAELIRKSYRNFDWTGAADVLLTDLLLPDDARLEGGEAALAHALDEATALACADALGAIRAANALARRHTGTRSQFGRSLDSFQVLQHRLVDMAIAEELAGPITAAAVAACECGDPGARSRAVSAAKVKVGEAARFVGEQCVQLHGGMGLVQDYPASHLFARLGLFELLHGDEDHHITRYAALTP